jgi:hypothetical protein
MHSKKTKGILKHLPHRKMSRFTIPETSTINTQNKNKDYIMKNVLSGLFITILMAGCGGDGSSDTEPAPERAAPTVDSQSSSEATNDVIEMAKETAEEMKNEVVHAANEEATAYVEEQSQAMKDRAESEADDLMKKAEEEAKKLEEKAKDKLGL